MWKKSKANAEKVVKAPKKPTITNNLASFEIEFISKYRKNNPAKKAPKTLIAEVLQKFEGEISVLKKNLSVAPIPPPKKTPRNTFKVMHALRMRIVYSFTDLVFSTASSSIESSSSSSSWSSWSSNPTPHCLGWSTLAWDSFWAPLPSASCNVSKRQAIAPSLS